jgi:hypothetical protein
MRTKQGAGRYGERQCGRCLGGEIHAGSPTELRKEKCPSCGGTGRAKAFLYPKPKRFRGEWQPDMAAGKEQS